jgi:exodeoxyribonuclease X
MLIRCLDLETTGEEPDVGIVEVGWSDLRPEDGEWQHIVKEGTPWAGHGGTCPWHAHITNPGMMITPESSGIHHITNEDMPGAMKVEEALEHAFETGLAGTIIAGHYIKGDQFALGGDRGYRWIDTWKIAVTLAPMAPNFSLQTLKYWLDLDVDRHWALPSHRAGPDSYVCAALLRRMLAKMSPQDMVAISQNPVFLPRLNFGKHAKVPINEIPGDYLDWILREQDKTRSFDENVMHTVRRELARRDDEKKRRYHGG